jgi:FAD-linked oxidoreductase
MATTTWTGEEVTVPGVQWTNWVGDQRCSPAEIARPRSRQELVATIAGAAAAGQTVKVAGSGHSFTDAALTDGVLVQMEALDRVLECDPKTGLVKVEAGIVLRDLNEELHRRGRAMANLGDIDKQTAGGAISTATHGTGAKLQNMSAQLASIELVTAAGETIELSEHNDPDAFRAARVGIGALGAIYALTLRTVPMFKLHRVDEIVPIDSVLADFERAADANEHFEFFTFPYSGSAITIRRNRSEAPLKPRSKLTLTIDAKVVEPVFATGLLKLGKRWPTLIPHINRRLSPLLAEGDYVDYSHRALTSERNIRFTEMEYAIPREHGPEVIRRVLDWIHSNRFPTSFPLECRVVAADDALLSPSHGRDTCYVAVHQFRGMEWRPYFEAVEAIAGEYGGRPHWGKRHNLSKATLAERYPRFGDFLAVRDRVDPDRVFANDYTRRCLGD